jgi:hypothetical protein
MALYIVRTRKDVKAGTPGYYDMLGNPIRQDAPAGRRLRMEPDHAKALAHKGDVEMLSPDGVKEMANEPAPKPVSKAKAKPPAEKQPTYKTRVEKPETQADPFADDAA